MIPAPPVPLVLSGASGADAAELARSVATTPVVPGGLTALARDLAARADAVGAGPGTVRVVALVHGPDEVAAAAERAAVCAHMPAPTPPGRLAFLFSGVSSQRVGMGEQLAAEFDGYAAALERFDAQAPAPPGGPTRREVVAGASDGAADAGGLLLDRPEHAQPALLAGALALVELLAGAEVAPDLVAGHSFGEIAAAAAAGVWSPSDAARLAAERGRLLGGLPADGAMVAIEAGEREVAAAFPGPDVGFSAVHGHRSVVVAGPREQVHAVGDAFAARGVRTATLPLSVAGHSPAVEPVLEPLRAAFAAVPASPTRVPLAANAEGAVVPAAAPATPEHWVRHCRRTVRWSDVVSALRDAGAGTYLEIGPSGVLSRLSAGCLPETEHAALVPAVTAEPDEVSALLSALAALEGRGHRVRWSAVLAASTRLRA